MKDTKKYKQINMRVSCKRDAEEMMRKGDIKVCEKYFLNNLSQTDTCLI